ncbi:MAG: TRAP transporter substrate-binding protein [Deltaproteobacteria bacterium]|nr:TRAP transporter substrate-binding protein [Deltaproteobacteria bacterium]
MKKNLVLVFMVLGFTAAIFFGAQATQARELQLTFMHYFPANHFVHTKIVQPWTELLEKESRGQVKFTLYPAAALAKPPDFFDAVVAGSVDIVIGYSGYTPGRFPISDVSGLPFMGYTSDMCASKTFMELWKTVPEIRKEWRAVKILWFGTEPPSQLHTAKQPVRTLKDMKGLKIKIGGRPAPYLKSLGATPIAMASPEVYDALAKGVIDGAIYPWEAIQGWKLGDLVYYHTVLNFYANPFFVAMNQEKWNSLPTDLHKLFDKYAGDYGTELWAREWDKGNNKALEWLKKDPKHEIITLSDSELERARQLEKPHYDAWKKVAKKKGVDGEAVLKKVRELAWKYAD